MRLLLPVVLLAATTWAQEQPAPAAAPPDTQEAAEQEDAAVRREESVGPGIISRGGRPSISDGTVLLHFRPFFSANAIYDSNLMNISLDSNGRIPQSGAFGTEATFGVTGARRWRHTDVELDYRGSARHYTQKSFYDGVDSTLALRVRHQASARVQYEFEESAARYSRMFSMPYASGGSALTTAGLYTNTDMFDTPTNVFMSTARVIYQRSARLSLSAGGSGFVVRRQTSALAGVTGAIATGDIAYRLSRNQVIGVDYGYTRFDYTGQFGYAEAHGVGVNYSTRFNRRWEMALRLGGYRVDSARVVAMPIVDPVLASMFPSSFGESILERRAYMPSMSAGLTWAARRSRWSAGYTRTMVPGNGVYLTSSADTITTGVSVKASRLVTYNATANYTSYSALTQSLGKYRSAGASGSVSIRLSRAFSLVSNVSAQRYLVHNTTNKRSIVRVSFGVAWSPGDYPLSLW